MTGSFSAESWRSISCKLKCIESLSRSPDTPTPTPEPELVLPQRLEHHACADQHADDTAYADANKIYLNMLGTFTVTGATGGGAAVFVCTPGTLGATTTCTYGPGL